MNRKLFLLGVLLCCLALPLGHLAAQEPAAVQAAESEPNDTIATADPIAFGDTEAFISPIGDVDYFRLSLAAGQRVYVAAMADCYPTKLETGLAVYDADGNLVAEPGDEHNGWPGSHVLRFIAPATASYFVRVISTGYYSVEEQIGPYTLLARNVPADEPADPFAPVNVPWDSEIDAALFAPYDFDWYTVHARPGDVFQVDLTLDTLITDDALLSGVGGDWLYEPGTASITYVVPAEADYEIKVSNGIFFCTAESFGVQPYHLTIKRNSLYVAGSKVGTVDGVAFGPNDVLAHNMAGAWKMVFDGEDVGLTKPLGGVEFMDDGSLLLSLNAAQALPGLGMAEPIDIVRFVPTQLGANTQGTFNFYLRGTQVGLTQLGERIDAIALGQDGLLISTYGSASVPKFGGGALSTRDEDLLLFHPNGPMPSAGTWELRLNGDGPFALGHTFSTNDLRGVSIVDDRYDEDHTGNRLIFVAERAYRYRTYDDVLERERYYTAAPGDLVQLYFWHDEPFEQPSCSRPILRTPTLGFPRVISSLSIGPGWNQ